MTGLILDSVLILLLLGALAYGVRLEIKLKALRAGQGEFARAVADLNGAAMRAESAMLGLRSAAEETDEQADKLCDHIVATADLDAISHMTTGASLDSNPDGTSAQLLASLERPASEGNMAFLSLPVVKGSYERVAAQLDEIARKNFLGDQLVYVVVGDASVVRPQLEALGLPVEERSLASIAGGSR